VHDLNSSAPLVSSRRPPAGRAPRPGASMRDVAAVPGHLPSACLSSLALAKRPERCAELVGEELRLLPGGEVAAPVDFVEVNEGGVALLRPAARRLILLARKDGRCNGDRDALRVEEATLVFPIEARR